MTYEPKIDDYVRWTNEIGQVEEGWVYFISPELPQKKGWKKPIQYFTLEIATKDMPPEIARTSLHKKIHVLVCCYKHCWHQVEYLYNRRDNSDVQMYHSQQGRYADIQ